jgi:hypothetical protein
MMALMLTPLSPCTSLPVPDSNLHSASTNAFIATGSTLYVTGSISTKKGLEEARTIEPPVAKKVNGVVITPWPYPIPAAIRAIRRPSVPEETPTAHWQPQ